MSTQTLAQAFWTHHAFKWDPTTGFQLASGQKSPYYVDCRGLLAHPEARWLVAKLAYGLISTLNVQVVGGLEIGAIPLATSISDFGFVSHPQQVIRTFVVRKQAKSHGLGKQIEGAVWDGDRALIVDDVLTSGGSLIKGIHAARTAKLEVSHALVIVDRQEQEGRHKVEQEGISLLHLLTLEDLKSARPEKGCQVK